jgi:hypothetical protein
MRKTFRMLAIWAGCGLFWLGAGPWLPTAFSTESPGGAEAEIDAESNAERSGISGERTDSAMESPAAPEPAPLFDYVPPERGAPANRIGGGTRGEDGEFLVAALAPEDHIGLTTRESPVLFWYRSPLAKGRFEFILNDETAGTVLARTTLSPPAGERFPSVDTEALGVRLEPDRLYSWFVTVVTDPADPSLDLLSGGYIRRIPTPPELAEQLAEASPATWAGLFARAGVWYDALALLMARSRTNPDDPHLKRQRDRMLGAVGMMPLSE